MFKNKNEVNKISNCFLLFIIVCSIISIISFIFGDTSELKDLGYTSKDITYSIISMSIYFILSFVALFITNKNKKIYSDEYTVTRRLFNFFMIMSIISLVLSFILNIMNLYFYDSFSYVSFCTIIFGYLPAHYFAIRIVSKENLFKIGNEKKVNIANLVIIILLINYYVNLISIIFSIIFNIQEFSSLLISLITSIVWIIVILISYKLINKKEFKILKFINKA